jgi:amidase
VLAGVPVTVKVNIDQAGFATTNGLKIQKDAIARDNSPVIDNLRKSGAVILGRTNCPGVLLSLVHHQPRCTAIPRTRAIPASRRAARRAARVRLSRPASAMSRTGTDIAGSIRYPAYANGVHGLRPTVGPHRGVQCRRCRSARSGRRSAQVSGPLARTIADLRISLAAMSASIRAIPGGCRRRWKA